MAKVAAVAVIAIAAFLVFHPGAASADKVAECLEKSGATVTQTRFLQGVEGIPPQVKSRLLKVEKRNYDVQLGSDSGLLILVRSSRSAEDVKRDLVAAEGQGIAQRRGRFVMYWNQVPSGESSGILGRCLH